jgi:hypothetical protein
MSDDTPVGPSQIVSILRKLRSILPDQKLLFADETTCSTTASGLVHSALMQSQTARNQSLPAQ